MNLPPFSEKETTELVYKPEEIFSITAIEAPECKTAGSTLTRFEWKRERYIWVQPDDIAFVISANHYVKALVKYEKQKKWMSRHCTIKELLATLPSGNFIRLNKFYLLNRNHFANINEIEKRLYLNDNFSIPVPHRISRFVLDLLKY